jgi:exopolysaccharide biosynthesis protein
MVLSIGRQMLRHFEAVKPGSVLQLSTACAPRLTGVQAALSGGPALVLEGRRQKVRASIDDAYELSSMLERHPRTAFGWNERCFFLVVVDGRQRDLSLGMTLDELSAYMLKLGCNVALNLDGGGSSTLWFDGEVRNEPCDGYERAVANGLLVEFRKRGPREVSRSRSGVPRPGAQ